MSENTNQPIIVDQNVLIPMRDGVRLAADVYRPAAAGRWPVLLTRVPYDKDLRIPEMPDKRLYLELNFDAERAVAAGYVVVAQDTRGRFASEGQFRPVADDAADGADTIAWAASQPWSSGQVGMFGESYQGLTQWLAAGERPPALGAIAPMHAPFTHASIYTYQGGAFQPAVLLWWALTQGAIPELQRRVAQGRAPQAQLDALREAEQNIQAWFEHLPQADMPVLAELAPYYAEWLADPAAQAAALAEAQRAFYPRVAVPALIMGGWYDYFLPATLDHYRRLKQHGGSPQARRPRLVVGPWTHVDFPGMFAERDYGPHAGTRAIDLAGMQLCWFDHWLKGIDNGAEAEKPVRIFVMGADEWRDEHDWPLPDTRYQRFYLRSGGRANTSAGDGALAAELPGDEPADQYVYDPRDPAPTVGGAIMLMTAPDRINTGPLDQRQVELRADVLCYTTPPLERPLEVIGPIELILCAASSAPDTDFTGKLVDVYPDGRAEILADGILRARYRESFAAPAPLKPGAIEQMRIDLGATANVFRAGHRIRLEVSSSNFPRFDRNTNTGGAIAAEGERDLRPASNRIYHSAEHPSYLVLPVIER